MGNNLKQTNKKIESDTKRESPSHFPPFSFNAGIYVGKNGQKVVGLSDLIIRLELLETNDIFEQSRTIPLGRNFICWLRSRYIFQALIFPAQE